MIALLALYGCGTPEPPPASDKPTKWTAPDAPAPLRRLTGEQYQRTVQDLFPGAIIPQQRWVDDPEVGGFDNNAEAQTASPLLVERVQLAAVQVSAAAMDNTTLWLPCPDDGGPDPRACGHGFLPGFARRAFRRTLTADEEALYLAFFDQQLDETADFRVALQLTVQALLNSPEFLYFFEYGVGLTTSSPRRWLTGPEVATRLSYFLWGTTPDITLLDAAEAGELDTVDGLETQVWRLLDHPRATDGVLDFHRQWLDLEDIDRVWLHYDFYPDWVADMNPAMKSELEWQILQNWNGTGTLASLLLDPATDSDPYMAYIYGVDEGLGPLPSEQRAGVLTRAGWLAATSHMIDPSPVQRGVWVLDRLLCMPPAAPPPTVDTSIDELFGTAETNRERYAQHTSDPACQGCHAIIDGIGFGFEHYDSMGAWRDTEAGHEIDATGEILAGDLAGTTFDGALELSELLAGSTTVHDCHVRHWYRYASGRLEVSADDPVLEQIEDAFLAADGDLRSAIVEIVLSDVFRSRPVRE